MDNEKLFVIKVGSQLIGDTSGAPLKQIASQINELAHAGYRVVLISSGAVELGRQLLGQQLAATSLNSSKYKPLLAAVGQDEVIARWKNELKPNIGQVLVDRLDFSDRAHFLKTSQLISKMLAHKVIPIVNENDTLSSGKRCLGNNDLLAAHVASMLGAGWLVLFTDSAYIYEDFPFSRKPIFSCSVTDPRLSKVCGISRSTIGTGGMASKLEAARIAGRKGINTLIGNHEMSILHALQPGAHQATQLMTDSLVHQKSFRAWLADISHSEGELFIDSGAAKALLEGNASLLLPGLISFEGVFEAREVVTIKHKNSGKELAKGLVRFSSNQLKDWLIHRSHSETAVNAQSIVVHRNDMVLRVKQAS